MKKDVPRHTSQPSKAEHSSESLLFKGERWFSGPIPPPEIGAGWKDVLPDAPDRIFKMAEKEQQHRHDTERLGLELQYKLKNRGQLMAFLIGIIGLGGGIGLLMMGSNLAGGSAFLISLTALVGTYLYNTKREADAEREQRKLASRQLEVQSQQIGQRAEAGK